MTLLSQPSRTDVPAAHSPIRPCPSRRIALCGVAFAAAAAASRMSFARAIPLSSGKDNANPLVKRQGPSFSAGTSTLGLPSAAATATTTASAAATATATGTGTASSKSTIPVPAIVIPLAIVGALFFALILWSLRKKMHGDMPTQSRTHSRTASAATASDTQGFQTIRNRSRDAADSTSQDQPTEPRSRVARMWGGFVRSFEVPQTNSAAVHGTGSQTTGNQANTTANGAQERGRRQRRRNRDDPRPRRTESGRSIRTLPEYKIEVSADEVVLYKAEDNDFMSTDTRTGTSGSQAHAASDAAIAQQGQDAGGREDNGGENDPEHGHNRSRSITANIRNSIRRSLRRSTLPGQQAHEHGDGQDADADPDTSAEANDLSPMLEDDETRRSEETTRNAVPGATPDYDALFPSQADLSLTEPAAQSHDVAADEDAAPVLSTTNRRSGVLRSIFSRPTPQHRSTRSSGAILPMVNITSSQPPSGDDASSATTNLTPPPSGPSHRRFHSNASVMSTLSAASSSPRPSASDLRLHLTRSGASGYSQSHTSASGHLAVQGRTISHPLRDTLVHMGSTGRLTADQMRFMGSVESLGRYGIPVSAASSAAPSLRPGTAASRTASPIPPVVGPTEDVGGPHPPGYVATSTPSPLSTSVAASAITSPDPASTSTDTSAADPSTATTESAEVQTPPPLGAARPPPLLLAGERAARERQAEESQTKVISPTGGDLAPSLSVRLSQPTRSATNDTTASSSATMMTAAETPVSEEMNAVLAAAALDADAVTQGAEVHRED